MNKTTGKILTEIVALIGALIGGGTVIKNKKDKNSRQQS